MSVAILVTGETRMLMQYVQDFPKTWVFPRGKNCGGQGVYVGLVGIVFDAVLFSYDGQLFSRFSLRNW